MWNQSNLKFKIQLKRKISYFVEKDDKLQNNNLGTNDLICESRPENKKSSKFLLI